MVSKNYTDPENICCCWDFFDFQSLTLRIDVFFRSAPVDLRTVIRWLHRYINLSGHLFCVRLKLSYRYCTNVVTIILYYTCAKYTKTGPGPYHFRRNNCTGTLYPSPEARLRFSLDRRCVRPVTRPKACLRIFLVDDNRQNYSPTERTRRTLWWRQRRGTGTFLGPCQMAWWWRRRRMTIIYVLFPSPKT